jgi:hypothetical protein
MVFMLLAFQLAFGSEVGFVSIAGTYSSSESDVQHRLISPSADDDCPMHGGSQPSASIQSGREQVGHHLGTDDQSTGKSTDKHDCCKFSGCQCGTATLVFNFPAARDGGTSRLAQFPSAARPVSSRADSLFRPPIFL